MRKKRRTLSLRERTRVLARAHPAHGRVLAPGLADPCQPGVAGEAEDVAATLVFEQVHDLGGAVMTVPAHGDLDPGPVAPDAADDVPEDTRRLFSRGPLAGTQQREHRLAGCRVEDVDGLEAIVVVMGVEQGQLLAAVDGIEGIVDIEGDALGTTLEASEEQIDHRQPHAHKRAPRRRVLEARQGWLAHQIATRLGQAATGQLERRIDAQGIEVVAILVATGDGEQPCPDHVGVGMYRARRIARVGQAGGKAIGDPETRLDPAQHQNAPVGRQPAAVEPGAQLLVLDG